MGKLILIAGENSSGKSEFAEELLFKVTGRKYYIATMIPAAEENEARIRKHRERRKDMGFTDFEKGTFIRDLPIEAGSYVLLEDVSNLLVNDIFIEHAGLEEALDDILGVAKKCGVCIAVTISRFDWEGSDEGTKDYIRQMGELNARLEECADICIYMDNGRPVVKKGELPDAL